jgi:hypothetical protein
MDDNGPRAPIVNLFRKPPPGRIAAGVGYDFGGSERVGAMPTALTETFKACRGRRDSSGVASTARSLGLNYSLN